MRLEFLNDRKKESSVRKREREKECVCERERDVKLFFFETWPRLEPDPFGVVSSGDRIGLIIVH